jgi:ribosomal protein S18 acetylase RimI-like enzyme
MRQSFTIRLGVTEDAGCLAVLATQGWLHTYATDGISTEISDYVLAHITPEQYAQLLRDACTQVLVAMHTTNVVGLAVVRCDRPCPDHPDLAAELQTLYVQEHFLRQGVGSLLLDAAEAVARRRANSRLWLTVNAHNSRAIAFYDRKGYTKVGTTYFVLGTEHYENHGLAGPAGSPRLPRGSAQPPHETNAGTLSQVQQ